MAGRHHPPAGELSAVKQQALAFSDLIARGYLRATLVIGAIIISSYLCYLLARPFLTPLALALVLSILFVPAHRWVETKLKIPAAAAIASVLTVAVIIFVPVTLLIIELARQAAAGAVALRAAIDSGLVKETLATHTTIAPLIQRALDLIDAHTMISDMASRLTNVSASFLRGSVTQLIGGLLTFYLLFYFLRDRDVALSSLRTFLPFTGEEMNLIFTRVVDTVHATIFAIVITGTIQGLLGGVIFAILGMPAPLLWGLVIGVVAIMPVLGTVMIWMPAAVFLALDGDWVRATVLSAAFIGISVIDSILYPLLVGDRMKLHTVLAFISAIGGLLVFGPSGFIIGPLIVAITLAIKDVLRSRLEVYGLARIENVPPEAARG